MIVQAKGCQKSVYVILLNPAVAKHLKVLRQNPNRDPWKPCVYVGMTGLPVAERFTNDRNGYKSSWVVKKYGEGLMPELYEHLNPMPYDTAVQMEKDLHEGHCASPRETATPHAARQATARIPQCGTTACQRGQRPRRFLGAARIWTTSFGD